jgi:hypothetical protein
VTTYQSKRQLTVNGFSLIKKTDKKEWIKFCTIADILKGSKRI